MKCSRCGNPMSAGENFCSECGGAPVQEASVQHCAVCGSVIPPNSEFCGSCGNQVNASQGQGFQPAGQPSADGLAKKKKDSSGQRHSVVIGALVAVILCLVLILAGGWYYFKVWEPAQEESVAHAETDPVEADPVEADPVEAGPKPKPAPAPAPPAPAPAPSAPAPEPEPVPGQFRYGVTNLVTNPTYTRKVNNAYWYYCDIPDNFRQYEASANVESYIANDNTAIMHLYARNNSSGLTPKQAMNARIGEIGGTVSFSTNGKEWYALSLVKGDTVYYIKGFVDEYVREMVIYYPEEYLEVYRPYIEYMEENFKRIEN